MKISIVATYFNRRPLLETTLLSINESVIKDFEFIVVDDGSDEEHDITDLMQTYPFLRVIKIKKEEKKHVNPSVPFNIGIKDATGEIIILQNPECFHLDDIMSYVDENLKENEYYAFSTYSINKDQTNRATSKPNLTRDDMRTIISPLVPRIFYDFNLPGWYNHSTYRPKAYHFCAAIHNSNMKKLNGFDERYGDGIGYDDDEFLNRVMKLGLNVRIIDDRVVVHQFHEQAYQHPKAGELTNRNRDLFHNVTSRENKVYADNNLVIKI